MVLTLLLVVGGGAVSLLLLDEVFVRENSPGFLFLKFLNSIRLPLGLAALALAFVNALSFFWRSGAQDNDYPLLTWIVVLINAFLAVREPVLQALRLESSAFAAFTAAALPHRKILGFAGLAVCAVRLVMLAEPFLRVIF